MRKDELVDRVARLVEPLGQRFTAANLDTLIQSGLVWKGDRLGNSGRAPQYDFSGSHYRRCLQVLRLRRQGLSRDDSVRVALFLAGYSAPASDVREALARDYGRALRRLVSDVRSNVAETWSEPKPGQQKALNRAFGPRDERLARANLVPNDSAILDLYRWARISHLATERGHMANIPLPSAFAALPSNIAEPIKIALLDQLKGILEERTDNADSGEASLRVQATIANMTDADLDKGRLIYQLLRKHLRNAQAIMTELRLPEDMAVSYGPAIKAVYESMREPEWRAAIYFAALTWAKADACKDISQAEIEKITQLSAVQIADYLRLLAAKLL